jgi:sugar phosphate isomerase/epimerase
MEILRRIGYDGVELSGDLIDLTEAADKLRALNLSCFSINGVYTPRRDLSSSDAAVRHQAIAYGAHCVETAKALGAHVAVVLPTCVEKLMPETDHESEWNLVAESLREVARRAEVEGITLVIEPINRFESYLVNRLETAHRMMEQVDSPALRLMGDWFHMGIEEDSFLESIRRYAPWIRHFHVADRQRDALGTGDLPVDEILDTLRQCGYDGPLIMEYDMRARDPNGVARPTNDLTFFEQSAARSLAAVRNWKG